MKAWIRGGTLLIPCRKLMQSGLLLENGKILGLLAPGEALPGEIAAMSRQVRSMHPPAGVSLCEAVRMAPPIKAFSQRAMMPTLSCSMNR